MSLSEENIIHRISEKIKEVAFKKISSVDEELIESNALNSITLVELALSLEKEFSVSIPFIEINKENFKTVGTIKNLIRKKLS